MIGLFTGVPRAGKSYTVVYNIAKKYCEKRGDGKYYLKDDYLLISDIEGLKIRHESLEKFLYPDFKKPDFKEKKGDESRQDKENLCPQCSSKLILKDGKYGQFYSCSGFPNCKYTINAAKLSGGNKDKVDDYSEDIKNLFSVKGFEKLREIYPDKKIVIVIDECQRYFHKRFYERDVFLAFEKHGHWGLDIYLIAHNVKKVSPDIVNLIEFETRIIARTFQFPGFISYLEKQGYEVVGRGRTPKKQEIFRLYKSQHFEQGDKVNRPFLKYFAFALIFLIFGSYFFYNRVIRRVSEANKPVLQNAAVQSSAPALVKNGQPSKNNGFFSNSQPEKDLNALKSESYLSAKDDRGMVYVPLSSLVLYDGNRQVLYVPYKNNMVPLALYPFKTMVTYKSGKPTVYRLEYIQNDQNEEV